jgi:integrase
LKRRGSVEKLPSGRFRARRLHPSTGRYASAGTFDTEREAELALERPFPVKGKGPTLEALWDDFSRRRRTLVRDHANEENRWALYVEQHAIGKIPVRDLSRRHFKDWLAWMHDKGLAAQTRRNALNLVRVVLHDAVDDEILTENPAREIRLPKTQEARSDDPWLVAMPEQQLALLEATAPEEWPAVAAALGLGLRNSEQWRLTWNDVDLDARQVSIRFSRRGKPTKTGQVRRLPLFGLALEAFRAAEHGRKGSCQYVFPSPRSNDRRADSSDPTHWKEWVKAAGLDPSFRWYDLRHSCATSLLAGWWGPAWTLAEIQGLLGHASIKTTERYAHFLNETLRGAAARTVESHDGADEAAKYRATFEIRTRDLRFTNPRHLEGFSALAVEEFHRRSTARDSRLAAITLEATRRAYGAGRSPLAKARVLDLVREGARLLDGTDGGRP